MSEESQVSKVTICVQILKWQSVSQRVTKGKYGAATAAKFKIGAAFCQYTEKCPHNDNRIPWELFP